MDSNLYWIVPLCIIAPVAFWCFICALISWAGGWWKLSKRFRAGEKPAGQTFWMQHLWLGVADYKGCVNIRVAPSGLHLSVLPIFAVAHPPLLIPWKLFAPTKTIKWFWLTTYTTSISLSGFGTVQIQFTNKKIADAMSPYLPAAQ